jgi:hypothetical protein
MQVMLKMQEEEKLLSLYSIFLTIASGASPIGSAGRARDEDGNIRYYIGVEN